jgi:hypothetical protein
LPWLPIFKRLFLKNYKWKLNILVSMCFWKIALYCKLNFIFQNQFNQELCNIICKQLGYASQGKQNFPLVLPLMKTNIFVR